MKSKPNIEAFLEGGAASERQKKGSTKANLIEANEVMDFRKPMVMQLPISLINALKKRALDLSLQTGRRVTQQQIVEEALTIYLHR